MDKNQPTHYQHYNPKYRLRKWLNENNKTFFYFKNGRFKGEAGIGNNIGWKYDLYEPVNNEYKINEIETNYFANDLEEKQLKIIENLEQIINARNVLNYKNKKLYFPENEISNYFTLKRFLEISVLRLPFVVEKLNKENINKLEWYKYSQSNRNTNQTHYIKIFYIDDDNKFICPDTGCIIERNNTNGYNVTFLFLTPKIALYSEAINEIDSCIHPNIYIEKVTKNFIGDINNAVPIVCDKMYISQDKIDT